MKRLLIPTVLLSIVLFHSCIVSRTMNLANCDFNFNEITSLKANDVDVMNKSMSDLGFMNSASLSKDLLSGNVDMDINMKLDVVNGTEGKAVLNTVDWILVLKNQEVLNGTTDYRLLVEPGQTGVLPLNFSFNLLKVLNNSDVSDLWDIAQNPIDPDVLTVKIKPSVQIAGKQVKYPGYININY